MLVKHQDYNHNIIISIILLSVQNKDRTRMKHINEERKNQL